MLIILDRDGVINYDSEFYIKSPEEWIALPNSLEAITFLNRAGHVVVVASNQSGVARGYYSLETLHKIHDKMQNELKKMGGHIDRIYFCAHGPEDECACRKPKPGMLLQIKKDFPDLFATAVVVGDSLRDIQAAQSVGCKSILVKTGNGAETIANGINLEGVGIFENLADFVWQYCVNHVER